MNKTYKGYHENTLWRTAKTLLSKFYAVSQTGRGNQILNIKPGFAAMGKGLQVI